MYLVLKDFIPVTEQGRMQVQGFFSSPEFKT